MQTVTNFSLLFWLKTKGANSKGVPVYCRVTINGQRAEIATGKYVNPENWLHGRLIAKTKEEKETNHYLANFQSITTRHYDKILENGLEITSELLKNRVVGKTEKKMSFLEAFDWMDDERIWRKSSYWQSLTRFT